jgi:hypothetical protein
MPAMRAILIVTAFIHLRHTGARADLIGEWAQKRDPDRSNPDAALETLGSKEWSETYSRRLPCSS